jgi:hypothetical protein
MKKVTFEDIIAWRPCTDYTEERIRELMGKRKSISWRDIVAAPIPVKHKIWALLHHQEFFSHQELVGLACDFSERVLHLFENIFPDDKHPRQTIEVARRWVINPIQNNKTAAHAVYAAAVAAHAAYVADAAAYAAAHAVYAAAYAAAADAADAVAYAAAAAADAADDAVDDADAGERKWQLQHIVEKLEAQNATK